MKTKKTILFLGILLTFITLQAQWTQIGSDIIGQNLHEFSGRDSSLSADGSIIAVSASKFFGGRSGTVRIYKNINDNWIQIGTDIDALENQYVGSSGSISLNANGSIIAIGSPGGNGVNGFGYVNIYKNIDDNWTSIGDFVGNFENDGFGIIVSLSSDGNFIAIGSNSGYIKTFQDINDNWVQIGGDLIGTENDDSFGIKLKLNSNGSILAVGSPRNDDNGNNTGKITLFKNIDNVWTQIGSEINGEISGYKFGKLFDLNSEGTILILSYYRQTPIDQSSHTDSVHVRTYNITETDWIQVGEQMVESSYVTIGQYGDLAISSIISNFDGSVIAIGLIDKISQSASVSRVQVYEFNENWTQVGEDISAGIGFGFASSINSNGLIVSVTNVMYGDFHGRARVFGIETLGLNDFLNNKMSIFPNPTNDFITISFKNRNSGKMIIYDITGKRMYLNKLNGANQIQIDISKFGKGIYFLKIQEDNNVIINKFIIN